jgi:hypothetical protein
MKLHHVPLFVAVALGLPLFVAAMIPRFAFANPPASSPAPPPSMAPAPARAPAPSPTTQLQPRPGLWHEASTEVDGVTVTKIRDTTGGDHNVCYLASRQESLTPYGLERAPAMLALTCVPEKRP